MSRPEASWSLTPHVCVACFGRVLSQPAAPGRHRYRCACCPAAAEGTTPRLLCACGMRLKGGRMMGLRCVPNPNVTPESPSEYVAEGGAVPRFPDAANDDAADS